MNGSDKLDINYFKNLGNPSGSLNFGNDSANRLPEVTAAMLELKSINSLQVTMKGSGAIDNLVLRGEGDAIPEPSSLAFLMLGGLAFGLRRKR